MSYEEMLCECCGDDIEELNEYAYMLQHELWAQCGATGRGMMLCIGCVEDRLGRQLTVRDFNEWIPLNCRWRFNRSQRLHDRMGGNKYHDCPFCLKAYPEWFQDTKGFDPRVDYPELFEYPPSHNVFGEQAGDAPKATILAGRPDYYL